MQLKHEFIKTCNQLGLEDGELALAEVIWQKAERAAWGLSQQVPSLLDNKEQQYKQSVKLEIDMIEPETDTSIELTQSDVQQLTKAVAYEIRRFQAEIEFNKLIALALWKQCDPDNPETDNSFQALNKYRNFVRAGKQKRDKLAALQYKLKKLQSFLGN